MYIDNDKQCFAFASNIIRLYPNLSEKVYNAMNESNDYNKIINSFKLILLEEKAKETFKLV